VRKTELRIVKTFQSLSFGVWGELRAKYLGC
jgi:hypothetical protein